MNFDIRPMSATLGAEISGVDLSTDLDAETIAAIRAAWLEHLVVVFPGQRMDEDD